ncbi:hypothetical protein [Variovorax saccharolyticus]|uniref:hypothetical protein n=1 Tax=Variovorax saccharolyticus TaxID=3053516 RepID=UPI002574E66C|nr:hypothetical protein [Variovorax sp. J22R187]MDM0022861.1 hypothetical protein [Variovorax sp. J22R187]
MKKRESESVQLRLATVLPPGLQRRGTRNVDGAQSPSDRQPLLLDYKLWMAWTAKVLSRHR